MRLAILFWFYKSFDVCQTRLHLIRRLHPDLAIFGLYGGPTLRTEEARQRLAPLVDDFYAYSGPEDASWKWRNGDQLLATWHRERGNRLAWDTVVVVQWDMLVVRPITEILAALKPGEALFSGFRPAAEVAAWWGWLRDDDPEKRTDRDGFRAWLLEHYGYSGELWCCLFIVVCLPRTFLDRYVAAGPPTIGFLEYKLPTLAKLWRIPICEDHPFQPWWASDPATREAPMKARILNAVGAELDLATVLEHVASPSGSSVIHPYRRPFAAWLARPTLARLVLAILRLTRRTPA